MFVEFVSCKKCNTIFNYFPRDEVKEHYESRKNLKRCLGCEKLDSYYKKNLKKKVKGVM